MPPGGRLGQRGRGESLIGIGGGGLISIVSPEFVSPEFVQPVMLDTVLAQHGAQTRQEAATNP